MKRHLHLTWDYACFYAAWTWEWAKDVIRETWDSIPGPWPVKIAVMALLGVCLLIPGPVDEIGVILALRGIAWLGRRRAARALAAD